MGGCDTGARWAARLPRSAGRPAISDGVHAPNPPTHAAVQPTTRGPPRSPANQPPTVTGRTRLPNFCDDRSPKNSRLLTPLSQGLLTLRLHLLTGHPCQGHSFLHWLSPQGQLSFHTPGFPGLLALKLHSSIEKAVWNFCDVCGTGSAPPTRLKFAQAGAAEAEIPASATNWLYLEYSFLPRPNVLSHFWTPQRTGP